MQAEGSPETDAGRALTLLSLPDEVLARVAGLLDGQELRGVCSALRVVYHAYATSATITRGYEGAVDESQVATLALCPALTRVDATRVARADEQWPLASLTRLTSLAIPLHWRAANVPPTLRELVIPEVHHDVYEDLDDWRDLTSLLAELRERTCIISLQHLCLRHRQQLLALADAETASRVRVDRLTLYGDLWPGDAQLARSVLSQVTCLELVTCLEDATLHAAATLPRLRHLKVASSWVSSFAVPLPHLTALELSNAQALTALQLSEVGTVRLRHLDIFRAPRALNVAQQAALLPELAKLSINVHQLEHLRALHAFRALTHLELWCKDVLPTAADLAPLHALRSLALANLHALKDLRELGAILPAQLTRLQFERCSGLSTLAGLTHASALLDLSISHSSGLRALGNESDQTFCSLTRLDLRCCDSLTALGSAVLPRLQEASFSHCHALADCTGLAALPVLHSLALCDCRALASIQLARAPALSRLRLAHMPVKTFLGLGCVTQLKELSLVMRQLSSLRHLGQHELLALTRLHVSEAALRDLDGLQGASQLREIELFSCNALQSLSGLAPGVREQLTSLRVIDCWKLRE